MNPKRWTVFLAGVVAPLAFSSCQSTKPPADVVPLAEVSCEAVLHFGYGDLVLFQRHTEPAPILALIPLSALDSALAEGLIDGAAAEGFQEADSAAGGMSATGQSGFLDFWARQGFLEDWFHRATARWWARSMSQEEDHFWAFSRYAFFEAAVGAATAKTSQEIADATSEMDGKTAQADLEGEIASGVLRAEDFGTDFRASALPADYASASAEGQMTVQDAATEEESESLEASVVHSATEASLATDAARTETREEALGSVTRAETGETSIESEQRQAHTEGEAFRGQMTGIGLGGRMEKTARRGSLRGQDSGPGISIHTDREETIVGQTFHYIVRVWNPTHLPIPAAEIHLHPDRGITFNKPGAQSDPRRRVTAARNSEDQTLILSWPDGIPTGEKMIFYIPAQVFYEE